MAYRRYRRFNRRPPIDDLFEVIFMLIVWTFKVFFKLVGAIIEVVVYALSRMFRRDTEQEFGENHEAIDADIKSPLRVEVDKMKESLSHALEVEEVEGPQPSAYRKRYRLMTNSESSFFHALKREIPPTFHILSKVRVADILETKDGHDYYKNRNKILPKHIDFVVCNETFEPLLAIELDGSSHNRPAQREIDKLKDEIFAGVGLPLVRPRVGVNFSEYCKQLRTYF